MKATMKRLVGLCFATLFAAESLAESPFMKAAVVGEPLFSTRDTRLDEVEILDSILRSKNEALLTALGRPLTSESESPLRLKWNKKIALKDGYHVLCLFDAEAHMDPGKNPRVLVLFSLDYKKIEAWGIFDCPVPFEYATMINLLDQPEHSDFITVGPSSRFGGRLWFEKYRITPGKIEKIGEGPEVTKIP